MGIFLLHGNNKSERKRVFFFSVIHGGLILLFLFWAISSVLFVYYGACFVLLACLLVSASRTPDLPWIYMLVLIWYFSFGMASWECYSHAVY
ncbi:hypothetical protein F5884DRAFT_783756 [Xylogone sp. PMI_703]|nr:hypothetical protein F5884DRAFT_783756 [Xylogone sp. PMI_703]